MMTKEMPKEIWVNWGVSGREVTRLFVNDKDKCMVKQHQYTRTDTITPPVQNDEALKALEGLNILLDQKYKDPDVYISNIETIRAALPSQSETVDLNSVQLRKLNQEKHRLITLRDSLTRSIENIVDIECTAKER